MVDPGLAERIREAAGRNLAAFARRIGIEYSRFYDWASGRNAPPYDALVAIAEEANVTLDWLLAGRRPDPTERPPPSWHVARVFSPGFARAEAEEISGDPVAAGYRPVINRIAAGPGADTTMAEAFEPGQADEWVECSEAPAGAVAPVIEGDSMMPVYRPGDVVVVDPARNVERGLAVVRFIDERGDYAVQLKRLHPMTGGVILESLNASPIVLSPDRFVSAYGVWAHLPRVIETA